MTTPTSQNTHGNAVRSLTTEAIERARAQARTALIGYLPAGYPTVEESIEAAVELGRHGADVIEIGIPYSDPVMDGPVIQAATSQVLADGFRVEQVFEIVRAVSEQTDAAVVVMTYWNLVDRMGVDTFARRLAEAGERALSRRTSFRRRPRAGSPPRTSTDWTASS